ncbi:hypothetical protein HXX02_02565 [Microbulbifer elongatus]|uniref:Sulfotransferase family protein n=1 Tax=Microbulbifer elongatus TaxID=86173 RepID=A0ABT1NWR5_9GAMM|nr:hypothetical protein [Microbulbifer elongatus]MCQ3828320.1 hypothetical protein [Microbulbifer elongatus]
MYDELVLHLGFHKTGSTSIQKTCFKNGRVLADNGWVYPRLKLSGKSFSNHSRFLFSLFSESSDSYLPNVKDGRPLGVINAEIAKSVSSGVAEGRSVGKKLLISGEDISRLSSKELLKLRSFAESHARAVRVLVYVRPPWSYFNSAVQQRVKAGKTLDGCRYQSVIQKIECIQAAFPYAEFYPFQVACGHSSGVVGHFLGLLGVDNLSEFEIVGSNAAVSGEAVRLMSYLNAREPRLINGRLNPDWEGLAFSILKKFPGSRFRISARDKVSNTEWISEDNKWLKENMGIEFCDADIVGFRETFPNSLNREQYCWLKKVFKSLPDRTKILTLGYLKENSRISDSQILSLL